jgi:hypothetical protein
MVERRILAFQELFILVLLHPPPPEPESQNGEARDMAIARKWLSKHIPSGMNKRATTAELLDACVFYMVHIITNALYAVKSR